MRLCNLTLAEMTEALARGWGGRDSRVVMLLQQERAGVEIAVDQERLREALRRRSQCGEQPASCHFGAVLNLPAPRLCFGTGTSSIRDQAGHANCSVRQTIALSKMWRRQRDGETIHF